MCDLFTIVKLMSLGVGRRLLVCTQYLQTYKNALQTKIIGRYNL